MRRFRFYPQTDLYYARYFLILFLQVVAAVLLLTIVADLLQKTDEFVDYADEESRGLLLVIPMALQYYLSFAPALILQHMLPLLFVVAGILTVTASSVHNEYTALRSSGISLLRSIAPVVLTCLLLAYLIQYTRDWYLPYLLRRGHAVSAEIKPTGTQPISLVIRDGDTMQSISMGHFDLYDNRYIAHNLRIEIRNAKEFFKGKQAFTAYSAWEAILQPRVDPDASPDDYRDLQWKPHKGAQRHRYSYYRRDHDTWKEPIPTYVTPAMLERQVLGSAVMTWRDLSLLGREELDARIEWHRRISEPWAISALLLVAVLTTLYITFGGREPSYITNVLIAIGFSCIYYVIRVSLLSFGESELISPFTASWLPVLLLFGAAAWLSNRLEH